MIEQDSILISNQTTLLNLNPSWITGGHMSVWLDNNMQAMKLTVVFTLMLYMSGLYPCAKSRDPSTSKQVNVSSSGYGERKTITLIEPCLKIIQVVTSHQVFSHSAQ